MIKANSGVAFETLMNEKKLPQAFSKFIQGRL